MVNAVGINPSPKASAIPPGPRLRPLGRITTIAQLSSAAVLLGSKLGHLPVN